MRRKSGTRTFPGPDHVYPMRKVGAGTGSAVTKLPERGKGPSRA